MDIEVCIVTYGNTETIERAISSCNLIPGSVGIALHDNCPTESSIEAARDAAGQMPFRYEVCDENCGFARGCNSLAFSSDALSILFLNPDAAICKWPSDQDQEALPRDSIIGLDVEHSKRGHWGIEREIWDEVGMRWFRAIPPRPVGRGYVSGAAMLVSQHVFRALNGFDPRFFMYYEDIDFCLRAGIAGFEVYGCTALEVSHIGGYSAKREDFGVTPKRSYCSAKYFHEKWGHSMAGWRAFNTFDALGRSIFYATVRRDQPISCEWWFLTKELASKRI
jgi:GT2 family glycosyltransferase